MTSTERTFSTSWQGALDAHAKNYSITLNGDRVELAPLYDLLTYAPYWNGKARLDAAMSVDGVYALSRISSQKLVAAGKQFGLGSEAEHIVESMRTGMVDAFAEAVAALNDSSREVRTIVDDLMRGIKQMPLVDAAA